MKSLKFIAPVIFVGIMSLMMFSCSKPDADNPSGNNDIYKVNILAGQFDPTDLTMLPGLKITWTNRDTVVHSLVSDNGIRSFYSGYINPGGTFSITPSLTGTYPYHCGIHHSEIGSLNVVTR